MKQHSPFLLYRDFISPLKCEEIISDLGFLDPDVDENDVPIKMSRHHPKHEQMLFDQLSTIIPEVFSHYNTEYNGTERMVFEYLAEGTVSEPECANSTYLRGRWMRTMQRDFTGFLFLNQYNESDSFDDSFEVYGGKLQFPQWGFSLMPERGTLVLFPSVPHFIYAHAPVLAGDMFHVKINMAAKTPYLYQPENFPGDYTTWFADLL